MALLAAAREILASDDVEFVASLDQLESDVVGPWTLRDALIVASGCDRKVGPFAYWEHREIGDSHRRVWERLAEHVDAPSPEVWSSSKGRTKADVLDVLNSALGAGDDIAAPETVTMRPWCTTKLVRTCRIPFVPLAALVHAWSHRGGKLRDLLDHFEIDATTDPWAILDRVEPQIREVRAAEDVADIADFLRSRMHDAEPEIYSPARLLSELDPRLTLDGVRKQSVTESAGS